MFGQKKPPKQSHVVFRTDKDKNETLVIAHGVDKEKAKQIAFDSVKKEGAFTANRDRTDFANTSNRTEIFEQNLLNQYAAGLRKNREDEE